MSNLIKLKRSAIQDKIPLTTDLALGELAINTHDGKIYIKKDDGAESIVEFIQTPQLLSNFIVDGGDVNRLIHFGGGTPSSTFMSRETVDGGTP